MKKCPKCNKEYDRLLAVSRRDNETMICDDCGTAEALDDFPFAECLEGLMREVGYMEE